MTKPSPKIIVAGVIAVVADFIQASLPFSSLGVLSPANVAIDFVVGGIMVWLLGWHWAFLPSFLGEMIPGVSLVPTWSMAVFIVGMSQNPAAMPPTGPVMIPTSTPGSLPGATPQTPHHKELTVQAQNAPQTQPTPGTH